MTREATKSATPNPASPDGQSPGQVVAKITEVHPKPLNLRAALAAFQAEMPKVHKGQVAKIPGKEGRQGYSYTYADLGDVTEVAMPLLTAQGLAFSCCPRRSESGAYELVGILMHTSGETLEGALPLNGRDPQQLGSALTYMRRYLLASITGIVTDDDDDAGQGMNDTAPTRQDPPPPVRPLATTDDPEELADTAQALQTLTDIALQQDPVKDLEWITRNLRREAGNITVEDLSSVKPGALWELVTRWQQK